MIVLVALLVCLIPTTIGGAAVGDRHRRAWTGSCSATCSRCRAAPSRPPATSTRCCSTRPARSRSATGRPPSSSRRPASPREAGRRRAALRSLADETPEGRSIVVLAKERYGLREPELDGRGLRPVHRPDPDERRRPRRPPASARARPTRSDGGSRNSGGTVPEEIDTSSPAIAAQGGTPLVVAEDTARVLGVIQLKDIVKHGMRRALRRAAPDGHPHRHDHRRQPAHREAIAAEAGVDDFLAEATPEDKMALIRRSRRAASSSR